jgi:hypothetical protein
MYRGLQARVVATRQELEVLAGDLERQRAGRMPAQQAQLQHQALGGRARAHARGLEILQVPQRDAELLGVDLGLRREQRRDLLQRLREIAILVERVDQHRDQRAVALADAGERELLVEVVAQRRRVGRRERAVGVVVVVRAPGGRGRLGQPVLAPLGGLVGRGRLRLRGARARVARRGERGARLAFRVLALEDRVLHQQALDLLVQLDRGQLQQADRLLQLRRQRQVLREPELQGGLHGKSRPRTGCGYMRKCSPR